MRDVQVANNYRRDVASLNLEEKILTSTTEKIYPCVLHYSQILLIEYIEHTVSKNVTSYRL